jgi:hypothetical protein
MNSRFLDSTHSDCVLRCLSLSLSRSPRFSKIPMRKEYHLLQTVHFLYRVGLCRKHSTVNHFYAPSQDEACRCLSAGSDAVHISWNGFFAKLHRPIRSSRVCTNPRQPHSPPESIRLLVEISKRLRRYVLTQNSRFNASTSQQSQIGIKNPTQNMRPLSNDGSNMLMISKSSSK